MLLIILSCIVAGLGDAFLMGLGFWCAKVWNFGMEEMVAVLMCVFMVGCVIESVKIARQLEEYIKRRMEDE